jgi:hypothetical protein
MDNTFSSPANRLTIMKTPLTTLLSLLSASVLFAMPQDYWKYSEESIAVPSALGLCISPEGTIFAGQNTSIKVLDSSGGLIQTYAGFTRIRGIAYVDSNNLFVYDFGATSRIRQVDATGAIVAEFGSIGSGTGQFSSSASSVWNEHRQMVSVDSQGRILAVDPNNYRVHVFEQDGTHSTTLGSSGSLPGQFQSQPISVATLSDGRIAVATRNTVDFYSPNYEWLSKDSTAIYGTSAITSSADGLVVRAFAGGSDRYEFDVRDESSRIFTFTTGWVSGTGWDSLGIATMPSGDILISTGVDLRIYRRTYNNADLLLDPSALPQPFVKAIVQRAGTTLVDIDFLVSDTDSVTVETAMVVYTGTPSLANLLLPTALVEGTDANLGATIAANTLHRVTWDAAADWNVDTGSIQVEILAKDDRGLHPIRWVTYPGEGGDPDLTISAEPLPSSEFYGLWVWFIAKRDPALSLVAGQIVGFGGAYDSQILYDGANTTAEGRSFLLARLNVATHAGDIVKKLP